MLAHSFFAPVSQLEVSNLISDLRTGTAAGFDNVPVDIVKKSADIISQPLTHIINLSIQTGSVPDQMKIARVIPIFKSGDEALFSNYRPVSVLPVFSKLLEKAVYNRIMKYLTQHNILFNNQYGFRKNHSTSFALIDLFDKISQAIDDREYTVGIFLDLSKAFGTINFNILFDKLQYYGIRGLALDWIKDYFAKRSQYVQFNGTDSTCKDIKCGVPQGSILGPLFFLIYVNDLSNASDILKFILFADDTNLFFSHKDPDYLISTVNEELSKLDNWFKANKLSLNVKKCNFIVFKPRQKRVNLDFSVTINNNPLKRVNEVVFLGVVIDEHVNWKPHIANVASKISRAVGIMFKSRFFLSKSSLCTLYFSLVYPYLHYCIISWGSTYPTNLNRLFLLQKRAVRIITKASFDAHTDPIFKELNLLKLHQIYSFQLGTFMFLYKKNSLPQSFTTFFPVVNQIHNYNTRTAASFYIPSCRTKIRQFSIKYQGPTFFNKLNSDICESSSLSRFKSKLKTYLLSLS